MTIYFSQPYWFLLAPVMILLSVFLKKTTLFKKTATLSTTATSVYFPLPVFGNQQQKTTRHKPVKLWLYFVLISCALAQPVSRTAHKVQPDSLRDIIFVADTSVGMSISDYEINGQKIDRLTLLKAVLSDFVDKLSGNRMALMVYADDAYVMSPLTRDASFIKSTISRIQPALAGRSNNLSHALNTVLKNFDFKTNKPTVIVLSQGANIQADISPLKMAEALKSRDITLHFIGIGSDSISADSKIKLIFDPIDYKLLQQMARDTGGEFFWAGKSGNFDSILTAIKNREALDIKSTEQFLIKHYYRWPLYLLFVILILSELTSILVRKQSMESLNASD